MAVFVWILLGPLTLWIATAGGWCILFGLVGFVTVTLKSALIWVDGAPVQQPKRSARRRRRFFIVWWH